MEILWKLRKIKDQIYKGNLGFYKNTKGILGRLVKKSLTPRLGGRKGMEWNGKIRIFFFFPLFGSLSRRE